MKIFFNLFAGLFAIFTFSFAACKSDATTTADPLLHKCWTNAFEEEDQDNIKIFRPCATHTFPAARYRNTFTLKENGGVEYSVLAPNDAHSTEEGNWEYDPDAKKLNILTMDGATVQVYDVVEIGEDVLRLKE